MANVDLFESKLDLDSHEEKGGHTLLKHSMTPDDLLLKESDPEKCLSGYRSKEIAEFWIQAVIDLNKKSIAAWYQIAQDFDKKTIHYTSEASVGFGARPGYIEMTSLYSLLVVLEKMPRKHEKDILILSSYPVMTKPEFIVAKDRTNNSIHKNWRIHDDDY